MSLVGNPRVAVLDELTTGLDPAARRDTWALIERVRERGVTIMLVTHSMEEAERLCDRVAVVDTGRVVALGTPGELAPRCRRVRCCASCRGPTWTTGSSRTFRRSPTSAEGNEVVVAGSADALAAVTAALAREGIFPERLRVEQATLEDAFVALTGRVPVTVEEAA